MTGSIDKFAQVWDARTGRPVGRRLGHSDRVLSVGFSGDGTRVVTASNQTVRVWNTVTGKPELVLQHPESVSRAVFSPDGQRIATVARDATRLWNARTGRPIGSPMKQVVPKDAVFSPDGTRLATWSGFRNAQLWNALTAQPLGLPLQHSEPISAVSFSSDGSRVATASRDWTARVWDVRTGQPISPPLQHFGPALDASFSPDGARLLTMSGDGSARLWHLPVTTTEDAPLIVELAEIVSGYHVSEAGSLIAVMDASVRLQGLREAPPAAGRKQGSAAALLRWVFEDPWQRRISHLSLLTANDYIRSRLSVCMPAATSEAAWHFPGHAMLRTAPTNCVAGAARDSASPR